jgi:hypothetical protein
MPNRKTTPPIVGVIVLLILAALLTGFLTGALKPKNPPTRILK